VKFQVGLLISLKKSEELKSPSKEKKRKKNAK